MLIKHLRDCVKEEVSALHTVRFNHTSWILILIAALNAVLVISVVMGEIRQFNEALTRGGAWLVDLTISWIQVRVALALIVGIIALRLRTCIGLVTYILMSLWILVEYIKWYKLSSNIKAAAQLEGFSNLTIPHACGLYGATSWDIAILVLTVVLFIWGIKIAADTAMTCYRRFAATSKA